MKLKALLAIGTIIMAAAGPIINMLPAMATPPKSPPVRLIGLTDNNRLIFLDADRSSSSRNVAIKGVDGQIIGIDVRPANGRLYGLSSTDKIYTIDPNTGATQLVSTLSTAFKGTIRSGLDFNPVPDRLRLVDLKGQNFRVNVDTGMVIVDKPLNYAIGDPNAGVVPNVTAAAYTNSFAGPPSPTGVTPATRTTQLFVIDSTRDVLLLQNPPNDGVLKTIGALGVDLKPTGEFDIFSPRSDVNLAFAVSGSSFYAIDLGSGTAITVGSTGKNENLIGLTFTLLP
jgi:hypothetical protein